MNKKVIPYVLAIPAFLLLLVFKIIPVFSTLIVSAKNFSPASGVFNSENAGFKNYLNVIRSPFFKALWRNTLSLSFLSIFFTCVLALLLIICISKMPNRIIKTVSIVIISIPAFIPISSYVGIIAKTLSLDTGVVNRILVSLGAEPMPFLAKPEYFPLIFALTEALRNVYIPVIIGVLACEKEGVSAVKVFTVIFIYALVRATLFLSPDPETLLMMYNPMVIERADVLDTYTYRSGIMQMQIATGSAVWVMKTIIQLLVNVLIYLVINSVLPLLKGMAGTLSGKVNRAGSAVISIIAFLLLAVGSIGITAAILFPSLLEKNLGKGSVAEGIKLLLSNNVFMTSVICNLIYSVFSCILYGFVTVTLAYPLTTKSKVYPAFLMLVMTLTSNNIMGEYLLLRNMGLLNSFLAVILQSSLSVVGAIALHFVVSGKFEDEIPTPVEYFKESLLPLVMIVGLFFISTWGGYLYQMLYVSDRNLFGIGLIIRQILTTSGDVKATISYPKLNDVPVEAIRSAAIIISSVIPVILGTVLLSLNKILPLLAAASQVRKS